MLATTRRPSASIGPMAAKVPSRSTTRATERLAWLPEPIADAQVSLLEGLHVVDAVPAHRDHVPGCLQCPDRGQLLLGPDPAEDVRRL